MNYELMSVAVFLRSHDRDVLDLQECPASYIAETEAQLAQRYGASMGRDLDGNLVWPIGVMRQHLDIEGEPQWLEPSAAL